MSRLNPGWMLGTSVPFDAVNPTLTTSTVDCIGLGDMTPAPVGNRASRRRQLSKKNKA